MCEDPAFIAEERPPCTDAILADEWCDDWYFDHCKSHPNGWMSVASIREVVKWGSSCVYQRMVAYGVVGQSILF